MDSQASKSVIYDGFIIPIHYTYWDFTVYISDKDEVVTVHKHHATKPSHVPKPSSLKFALHGDGQLLWRNSPWHTDMTKPQWYGHVYITIL